MSQSLDQLVDDFLDHHFAFHPVDASFMGVAGHDGRLPRADANAVAAEQAGLAALTARLTQVAAPETLGGRIERRFLESQLTLAQATLTHRPPSQNPAWYSGEAAFSIIALLLPQSAPTPRDAVLHRLRAIPDFLTDGAARLTGAAIPAGWRRRSQSESLAFARFLEGEMRSHPAWDADWLEPARAAARSVAAFAVAINGHVNRDPAAGRDYLATLMTVGYGLDCTPEEAEAEAEHAFAQIGAELEEAAARLDPTRSWRQQVAALADARAPRDDVDAAYHRWHQRCLADAAHLVTPAGDYNLAFERLPPWFATAASELYFLSYRSPPAMRAGNGSVYWIPGPGGDEAAWRKANNPTTIKLVHAAHHGGVGHHTQNARARNAPSRLARLAGVDCAAALAFFPAGMMAEGWACYAMGLMRECPGFYQPAELLALKQFERRDAASVLVDIRLHTGRWSLAEAARFYREEADFAPARVESEITRNSIYPGSRLMYHIGARTIRAMRQRWHGDARAFHDQLLGHGSVPFAWIADELFDADAGRPTLASIDDASA